MRSKVGSLVALFALWIGASGAFAAGAPAVGTPEVVSTATIQVQPDYAAEFRTLALDLSERTKRESGCLYYSVVQSTSDANSFFVYEAWQDQAAMDAHIRQAYVTSFLDHVSNHLATPMAFARYQPLER
jgi:quinol monooxygenase YgiN